EQEGETEDDREEEPEQRRAVSEELLGEDLDVRVHRVEVVVARWHRPRIESEDPGREQHRLHQDLKRDDDPGHQVEEDDRGEQRQRDVARDLRAARAGAHGGLSICGGVSVSASASCNARPTGTTTAMSRSVRPSAYWASLSPNARA